MKRLLVVVVTALLVVVPGCGTTFFVSGALGTETISGTVTVVQVISIVDNGVFITVTFVTFQQSGVPTSMNFCGDQQTMFPMNQFVTASFRPGPPCASLVRITIG